MAHIRYKQLGKAEKQLMNHELRKCICYLLFDAYGNLNDTPGEITMEDFEKIKEFFDRQVIRGEGNVREEEKT